MKDKSAEQQRLNQIMPRYAPDQDEQVDQRMGWEEFANIPVTPRRSPWSTPNSDDESVFAQVSDSKVPLTPKSSASLGLSSTVTGVSEEQVLAIVTSPSVIAEITQAVIAALPIVEFKCPD